MRVETPQIEETADYDEPQLILKKVLAQPYNTTFIITVYITYIIFKPSRNFNI